MSAKKIALFVVIVLIMILMIIITTTMKDESEADYYLIKADYYYIKHRPAENSINGNLYEYAIVEDEKVIFESSNLLRKPDITWNMRVLRVETAYGTNHREVLYYNSVTKTLSKSFFVPSAYADYISGDVFEPVCLFATFDYDENRNTVLNIHNIFNHSIVATIQRDFIAPTSGANSIVFINENSIFVDYDTIDGSDNRKNNMEVIIFGHTYNSIIVIVQK